MRAKEAASGMGTHTQGTCSHSFSACCIGFVMRHHGKLDFLVVSHSRDAHSLLASFLSANSINDCLFGLFVSWLPTNGMVTR